MTKGFIECSKLIKTVIRTYSKIDNTKVMKYLNVAEKNDAAKNIAAILSNGNSRRVSNSNVILSLTTNKKNTCF